MLYLMLTLLKYLLLTQSNSLDCKENRKGSVTIGKKMIDLMFSIRKNFFKVKLNKTKKKMKVTFLTRHQNFRFNFVLFDFFFGTSTSFDNNYNRFFSSENILTVMCTIYLGQSINVITILCINYN